MPCQACGVDDALEVCLFCGRSFCSQHRGESGGVPACTGCLKAEAARKRAPKVESERLPTKAARPIPATSPAQAPADAAPAPLPEPQDRLKPILIGLGAALPAGLYVNWMIPKIVESSANLEQAGWVSTAGPAAAGLIAFAGVWAIAKTKL